jgi:hypothetical protein
MLRANFAYDTNYPAEALPVIRAEFRRFRVVPGLMLDHVIPDTGAGTTALPWVNGLSLRVWQISMAPCWAGCRTWAGAWRELFYPEQGSRS